MTIKPALWPFRRRVNIERKVLKLVNSSLTHCQPLTGLTEQAINTWAIDLNRSYAAAQSERVVRALTEISVRSRLNTDCSRDVFSNDDVKSVASIRNIIDQLAVVLVEEQRVSDTEKDE